LGLIVWLFAGGGEAELGRREANIEGIDKFFAKYFPDLTFVKITPVRNKRPPHRVNPNASVDALGKTGESFAKQIKSKLEDAIKYQNPLCDVILILDDLDCNCNINRTRLFNNAINQAGNETFKDIKRIICFASPELEAWIIADWENTIAKHIDFKQNQQAMQSWLIENNLSFDYPEDFSSYDATKKACHEKLSELLIESSRQKNQAVYSKSQHTPILLHSYLNPDVVVKKCPLFRDFFTQLQKLNQNS
jgi:hypothetical protein